MTPTGTRLSICVINHNYGRFVGAAIDSALDQTGVDAEVLVVDDGSTDDSRDVIGRYGDRVRTVLKENGGQASAFNAAIEASTGDAVLFLDADDMLEPGIGGAMAAAFAADERVVKVQCRMRVVDADGRPNGVLIPPRPGILPSGDLRDHVLRYRSYPWPPSSAMAYRRHALLRLAPVPEERHTKGGCDGWLSEVVPLLGLVRSLDDVGVRYRRHGTNAFAGSAVNAESVRKKIEATRQAHADLAELGRSQGIDHIPESPEAALDAAYAGYRLASLVLDPARHPVPGDRRIAVALHGWRGLFQNRFFGPRQRLARAAWFALAGLLPRVAARPIVRWWLPDGPRPAPWQRR